MRVATDGRHHGARRIVGLISLHAEKGYADDHDTESAADLLDSGQYTGGRARIVGPDA